jgi:hypothetical protein
MILSFQPVRKGHPTAKLIKMRLASFIHRIVEMDESTARRSARRGGGIVEIGNRLIAVRKTCGHGMVALARPWVRGWRQTARRFSGEVKRKSPAGQATASILYLHLYSYREYHLNE